MCDNLTGASSMNDAIAKDLLELLNNWSDNFMGWSYGDDPERSAGGVAWALLGLTDRDPMLLVNDLLQAATGFLALAKVLTEGR